MTIGEAIRTHALTDAAIAAAISDRIYAVVGPAVDKDAIVPDLVVYGLENEEIEQALDASNLYAKSIYSFEISCEARGSITSSPYDRCQSISDLFLLRFHGYRGTMGGVGGIDVKQCRQIDRQDSFDFENGRLIKRQQFEIKWKVT